MCTIASHAFQVMGQLVAVSAVFQSALMCLRWELPCRHLWVLQADGSCECSMA